MLARLFAVLVAVLFLFLTFGPDDFPPLGPQGQRVGNGEYQMELPLSGGGLRS